MKDEAVRSLKVGCACLKHDLDAAYQCTLSERVKVDRQRMAPVEAGMEQDREKAKGILTVLPNISRAFLD